jgi:Tryptophan dimethylallyltransferase
MELSQSDATIDAADVCVAQLRDICVAAGLAEQQERVAALFNSLCDVAGLRRLPVPPRWSGVTDDCTPIEFSTSFDARGTRVRFLIEAQDDPASPASYWAAGERLGAHLGAMHDVVLEPMAAIKDLFSPTDPNALIAIWHSLEFRKDGPPLCKIYLNPAARGRDAARTLIVAALDRLGFGRAIRGLLKLLHDDDMITHLAIDLVTAEQARVKVYARHFRAAPANFDRRAEEVGADTGLHFADVCEIICPCADVLSQRPVMTCYHLTAADPAGPAGMTLYLPLYPYASTDRVASERIAALLSQAGFGASAYRRIADGLIARRSGTCDGLHTYIAYKRSAGGSRGDQVTAYFSPSLFQPQFGRLALDPDHFWPSPLS